MKKYTDSNWLKNAYLDKELSINDIASMCGVTISLIHRYLKRFNIPRRPAHGLKGIKCGKWKGGRTKASTGYIWIHISEPHLRQISKNHLYVPEQILVVEKYLNRLLNKDELIHHINGIRDDNRIENLYLFPNESSHQQYHQKLRKGYGQLITASNIL